MNSFTSLPEGMDKLDKTDDVEDSADTLFGHNVWRQPRKVHPEMCDGSSEANENCSTCVINETKAPPMRPLNAVERAAAPIQNLKLCKQ